MGGLTIDQEVRKEMQSTNRIVTAEEIKERGSVLVYEGIKVTEKETVCVSLGSLKVTDGEGKIHFKFDSFDVEGSSPQEMGALI